MARSLLAALPQNLRAAFPLIKGGVRRGRSVSAIQKSIRDAGFSIPRNVSLTPIIQGLRAEETIGRSLVQLVTPNEIFRAAALPESVTEIRRKFSYRYLVTGTDHFGKPITRNIQVATDNEFLTRGDLDELAQQVLDHKEKYPIENGVLTLELGVRRPVEFNV